MRELFECEDTSFTDFVLTRRLARAHRLLIDPQWSNRNIAFAAVRLEPPAG
jgi:hypothetical protein